MRERTFALLKPEGAEHLRAFVAEIYRIGLLVALEEPIRWDNRQLLEAFVDKFYKDAPASIKEAIADHWCGYEMPYLTISGDYAVQRFLALCGTEANPGRCASRTLRNRFGIRVPYETEDGLKYYMNALHRPKTLPDVVRETQLLNDLGSPTKFFKRRK